MYPILYLVFLFSPTIATSNPLPVMPRIGLWFESGTIDLVASTEFLISPAYHKFKLHFPNSPFLLNVVPLAFTLKFPEPFSLSRLRKPWLTVLIIDSFQNQLNAFTWKLSRFYQQKTIPPEYFLFYPKLWPYFKYHMYFTKFHIVINLKVLNLF